MRLQKASETEMPELLITNFAAILGLHFSVWLLSLIRRHVSIIDLFWGLGFVLIAWLTYFRSDADSSLGLVIASMVTLWGVRLSGYLTWRNWGQPEDRRYGEMRGKHGARFPLVSLLTVFGLQAVLTWIISLPLQLGIPEVSELSALRLLGIGLWLVGLSFESVGDLQLARFKADPANRGKVMNQGLWRYTRHPNYFGDCVVWWGFYLSTVQPSSWWLTLLGPLLMSFLLMRVSGVTLLEKSLSSRLEGYEAYVTRTSAFMPWPPRNE